MQNAFMKRCDAIEHAAIGEGAFSPGPAVWVGRREVAHFDSDGALDVRLTKQVIRTRREELKNDERITLRESGSDWIEVRIASDSDVEFAFELVEAAVAANLSTAPLGTPPAGAELQRRRRFH